MRTPWLREQSPSMQVMSLMLLFFACGIFFGLIAQQVIGILYGVDLAANPELLSDYSDPNSIMYQRILTIFNQVGLFLIPALVMARLVAYPVEDFHQRKKAPQLILAGLVVLIALFAQAPTNFIYAFNQSINFPDFLEGLETNIISMEKERQEIVEALFSDGGWQTLIINLFLLAVLPAIAEEFFFRGTLQKLFQKSFKGNIHLAIWICAFVFSFIHFEFLGFIPRVLLGALLGYVYYWSGNIWYAVVLHFSNNGIGIIIHSLSINGKVSANIEMIGANKNETIPLILSTLLLAGSIYYFGKKVAGTKKEISSLRDPDL